MYTDPSGEPEPFYYKPTFLALVIASIVLTAGVIEATAYFRNTGSWTSVHVSVSSENTIFRKQSRRAAIVTKINEEKENQLSKFMGRLVDPHAFFLCFRVVEEEGLYAKMIRDEGVELIRKTLKQTIPRLLWKMLLAIVVIIESHFLLKSKASTSLWELVASTRPFYLVFSFAVPVLYCLGFFLPEKKDLAAKLFPYVALVYAAIVIGVFLIPMFIAIRFGLLNGNKNSPWDGEMRLVMAMLCIFIPQMFHLPLGFATVLNFTVAIGLELFLFILQKVYGYKCECYAVPGDPNTNAVSRGKV